MRGEQARRGAHSWPEARRVDRCPLRRRSHDLRARSARSAVRTDGRVVNVWRIHPAIDGPGVAPPGLPACTRSSRRTASTSTPGHSNAQLGLPPTLGRHSVMVMPAHPASHGHGGHRGRAARVEARIVTGVMACVMACVTLLRRIHASVDGRRVAPPAGLRAAVGAGLACNTLRAQPHWNGQPPPPPGLRGRHCVHMPFEQPASQSEGGHEVGQFALWPASRLAAPWPSAVASARVATRASSPASPAPLPVSTFPEHPGSSSKTQASARYICLSIDLVRTAATCVPGWARAFAGRRRRHERRRGAGHPPS